MKSFFMNFGAGGIADFDFNAVNPYDRAEMVITVKLKNPLGVADKPYIFEIAQYIPTPSAGLIISTLHKSVYPSNQPEILSYTNGTSLSFLPLLTSNVGGSNFIRQLIVYSGQTFIAVRGITTLAISSVLTFYEVK